MRQHPGSNGGEIIRAEMHGSRASRRFEAMKAHYASDIAPIYDIHFKMQEPSTTRIKAQRSAQIVKLI
ncbi:MAG: hypothetical protein JOY53_01035 [Acidobacteriaceae bacterium]|nr:hypothetical protein [Acidobacteriaceae bacterium]